MRSIESKSAIHKHLFSKTNKIFGSSQILKVSYLSMNKF